MFKFAFCGLYSERPEAQNLETQKTLKTITRKVELNLMSVNPSFEKAKFSFLSVDGPPSLPTKGSL
jgi:hypothetical protein